jgi:hypothetical protein
MRLTLTPAAPSQSRDFATAATTISGAGRRRIRDGRVGDHNPGSATDLGRRSAHQQPTGPWKRRCS